MMNRESKRFARSAAVGFAIYTIAVFTMDTLALHRVNWIIDWSMFKLQPVGWASSSSALQQAMSGFDVFKFVAWFLIPFVISLPFIEWSWFSPKRWKRADFIFMSLLVACGIVAVLSIAMIPSLRAMYPSMSGLSGDQRAVFVGLQVFWIVSWLPGWEFLTRYAILRNVKGAWPQNGWKFAIVGIPILEMSYHLVQGKGILESAAMFAFGVVLCIWAIRRENALLPFIAHAFVEVALVAFLLAV